MGGNDPQEREFDVVMARAGLQVPPDLRQGALAAYRELTKLAEALRQPRQAEDEPAGVFQLDALLRGGGP